MIHTYEQKLIWTDFQGMTMLIGKLEPFYCQWGSLGPLRTMKKLIFNMLGL